MYKRKDEKKQKNEKKRRINDGTMKKIKKLKNV